MNDKLSFNCWKCRLEVKADILIIEYTEFEKTDKFIYKHKISDIRHFINMVADIQLRLNHVNNFTEFRELAIILISNYNLEYVRCNNGTNN